MQRVRVKICGITRPEDAISAAMAGADAIGLVFYENSSRFIETDKAMEIVKLLPPFISKVGLFVDMNAESIKAILEKVPLDILQFHGNETPEQCRQFGKSYIKAVKMGEDTDYAENERRFSDATALILDTFVTGFAGGTGQVFDWGIVPENREKPVILAGGLDVDNVADAIFRVRPYAVDVSSGVESSKGIKDENRIAEFIQTVNSAGLTAYGENR